VRVGVTGATGFVGRAVTAALVRRGDAVTALTRDPAKARMPAGIAVVRFDVNDPAPNPGPLEGLDAVIHLAGEIVDGRWTTEKKKAIRRSRVEGTRNLVASLDACERRPRVLASASAVGFYGDRGDEPLDESSAPGDDFLASVCTGWEREAAAAADLGMRVAMVRVSFAVGHGGAILKLLPIFRFGAGGPLGSGRQWMPWIHVDDLADLFCFVVDRDDISGPVAGVAPDYAQNRRVMHAVGRALGRPALAPAPGFALTAIVGEFAHTLLGGQLIVPAKALDAGFEWKHPRLEEALIGLLAPESKKTPGIQRFESEQVVRAPIDRVFDFFSDPGNLVRLTPPEMGFSMTTPKPSPMRRGAVADYSLKVRGMRVRWRSMIARWEPQVRFADVQVRGPYLFWRHTHEFEEKERGVAVRDLVEYSLPFAPLSDIALSAVRRDIESVFAYRRRSVEDIFTS
jgi:uncharacterized protein (TIGR01777 family)